MKRETYIVSLRHMLDESQTKLGLSNPKIEIKTPSNEYFTYEKYEIQRHNFSIESNLII